MMLEIRVKSVNIIININIYNFKNVKFRSPDEEFRRIDC